ncbi:docking protein 5-like [Asterias rubens]|uniref:docking protein 5-like n=1 Tax=Asterias rubens TaxID=7604 RepID=UPI001454FA7A|nr:docking protein 5-like [Asterias rubens]
MSGEFDDLVKQGYVRTRSRNLGIWQRRWVQFKKVSSKGPKRLEKYIDEKSALCGGLHKVIFLDLEVSATRLPRETRRYAFAINFKNDVTKHFCCDSDTEADDWCKVLCLGLHSTEQCAIQNQEPDLLLCGLHKEQSERFHVNLNPTPQLSIAGECTLQVTDENIYLWDVYNVRLKLASWSLQSLLQYGRDTTRFIFQANKYCESVEGLFTVQTVNGEEIYQRVHLASIAIAEMSDRINQREQHNYQPQYVPMDGCNDTFIESTSHLNSTDENGNDCTVIYRQQPFKNHNATSFHLPLDKLSQCATSSSKVSSSSLSP